MLSNEIKIIVTSEKGCYHELILDDDEKYLISMYIQDLKNKKRKQLIADKRVFIKLDEDDKDEQE